MRLGGCLLQHRIIRLSILLTLFLLAVPASAAVEIYQVRATEQAPAWVYYTLNCPADVTIEIRPAGCESGCQPVRTVHFPGQPRGKHQFLWNGLRDDGHPAPEGAYTARITAVSNQARWDPIIGLFKNDDWENEYPPRPLPACPNSEGFYGIGINRNPSSPFYGRIYVSHKVRKHVFMYDPDGEFIGHAEDPPLGWGPSAPWDISIAEDDYVYVDDRTNRVIHCFTPDGQYVSTSPQMNYSKAIYAHTDASGATHVFQTGGPTIRRITLAPDHVTWGTPCMAYTPGTNNLATLGIWVAPDLATIYNCYSDDTDTNNPGLTRWYPSGACTYDRDGWTSGITNPVVDAEMSGDETYLWVTRMSDATVGRAIHKVRVADGTPYYPPDADYDVVTWALMCTTDGVGNVAVTFGKNTSSWAQYYWGLFAEPGVSQAEKTTGEFTVGPNSNPVILPESIAWTFDNSAYPGRLPADDTSTASLRFKVYDCNGWGDVVSCTLDLTSLGYGIIDADSIEEDTTDPNGLTAVVSKHLIRAKRGAKAGLHQITVTLTDHRSGSESMTIGLEVAGTRIRGAVGHTRFPGAVEGATVRVVGGGIAGGEQLTYTLGPTDASGFYEGEVSEGAFTVTAQKAGYGSAEQINISVPMPALVPAPPLAVDPVNLRPCTVAEARALPNGVKVNVEGVCFAQPVGYAPTNANGLAPRVDTQTSRNQWYICDPNDPDNGILCMISMPSATFAPQWNDPSSTETYIGKRPAVGETIMLTGMLDWPGGHERRVLAVDDDIISAASGQSVERYYQNRGDLGGLPAAPKPVTCAEIARNDPTIWGKLVRTDAWVVEQKAGGANTFVIADYTGTAELLLEMPESLGFTEMPSVGCMHTIIGATGRTGRYENGCIRARSPLDVVLVQGSCSVDQLPSIRSLPPGASVQVYGALTGKWADFFYIEDPGRRAGIRVRAEIGSVAEGSLIKVVGTLDIEDGERLIVPTAPPMVMSTGNQVPAAYDLRTRDIGGSDYDAVNPGVTDGRGALNVGLRVRLQGMVTDRDPDGRWFCVWDGINHRDAPAGIGSGSLGIRVVSDLSCAPWVDWVEVVGIVSTDCTIAPGRVTPVVLATSASKVTSFDTIESPAGHALTAGWNLVSLPAAPAGTGDGYEFSAKPWDAFQVLTPGGDPFAIDCRLLRWENCTGALVVWDVWSELESHGPFGGLAFGDGYWLQIDEAWPVSYSGKRSTLDQWTGICAPGWMIIGQPKERDTPLADVLVHDGGSVCTMTDAVLTRGWIDCIGYWWDNQTQALVDIGIPECWGTSDALQPWHGYWLQAYRGGLSLVAPE